MLNYIHIHIMMARLYSYTNTDGYIIFICSYVHDNIHVHIMLSRLYSYETGES